MGFLDFLTGKVTCPNCGTKGARKEADAVRCPNPHCSNFDPTLQGEAYDPSGKGFATTGTEPSFTAGAQEELDEAYSGKGNFTPARPVVIRYVNFQNKARAFTAEAATAERRRNHLVVQVTPTGARISLSRKRIQNLSEVESACPERVRPAPSGPTPNERRVLKYHSSRKTTSPLYEKLRAKYPNWS